MAVVEKEVAVSKTQGERAWEIYYQLRDEIETPENVGKLIVVDTDGGDYEIAADDTGIAASRELQGRHPGARLFTLRIGYKTAFSFAGGPERIVG